MWNFLSGSNVAASNSTFFDDSSVQAGAEIKLDNLKPGRYHIACGVHSQSLIKEFREQGTIVVDGITTEKPVDVGPEEFFSDVKHLTKRSRKVVYSCVFGMASMATLLCVLGSGYRLLSSK